MIKALRITLSGSVPYEHVTINSHFLSDSMSEPNIFEDSQLVVTCKHGKFILPDYSVLLIQIHNHRLKYPKNALKSKRILLSNDLNYQDCYIINQEDYGKYDIPQVFREYEQLSFMCKDGLFITTDFQVQYIQL